jgi:hypothetical protein
VLRVSSIPLAVPARTLGEAVSEAIREVAHEMGAYCPSAIDDAEVEIDRVPVTRIRSLARLLKELWKRGARQLD